MTRNIGGRAVGRPTDASIVGREAELALLRSFLGERFPRGLLLSGDPGIGKTRIWEAGVETAQVMGMRVLTARPSDAEARLSFAALIDLLGGVSSEELAALPAPQLQALEVALLREAPAGPAPGAHAISLGLLNALRALAAERPLVLAVDDVQWLDRPSAEALAFAARRLEGAAVGFLLATRPASPSILEQALEPAGLERHDLTPLSVGALRRILSERLALSLPRQLLRRIVDTTLGNPLFALEVGRTLAERGPPAPGEEIPLPATVEDLLGPRVEALPEPTRRLLLAVALSANLRPSQLAAIGDVEDAVDAGVLLVEGDRVRPSHPLLAAVARKHSSARERRELHVTLAETVGDTELRALHLALASNEPDDDLAASVAAAAAAASARGAAREAVVLADHALRLTPPDSAARGERVLELAGYLEVAGERQRLTDLLAPEVEALPPGEPRVRAYLLLAAGAVKDNDEIQRYLVEALAAGAREPAVRAQVLVQISENESVIRVQAIADAEASALEALTTVGEASDTGRRALYALAWARALRGRAIDDLCAKFRAASGAAFYMATSPDRVAGQRHIWRGDVGRARELLTELLVLADQRGESYSYVLHRLHMCQLELRVGNCPAAARVLDEWAEASEDVLWPMYERCRALLAAAQGRPAEARRWGGKALAAAEETGTRWDLLEARRALGVAALLAHEPAEAAEQLRAVWEHTNREGVDEPGVFPVAPELVEALVELGSLDEARAVAALLRELGELQQHPWALVTANKADALIRLASPTYDEEAAAALEGAAVAYGQLGLRSAHARTLLDLGRAQRRFKKWGPARESLEQAAEAFEELGAPGWAEEARSELARVGARRPRPSGELTPTERRVAELAAEGLANKEIAQTLHVTVNTVEFHLRNAYGKLGIRSRAQLSSRIGAS